MASNSKLTIPSSLYERLQRLARRQRREIPELAAEALAEALSRLEADEVPDDWAFESGAFVQAHPELLERYRGEYVAFHMGRLIDHDPSLTALMIRVDERFPDEFVLVRPVTAEAEITYQLTSIRWA